MTGPVQSHSGYSTLHTVRSALRGQHAAARAATENLANVDSGATKPGGTDFYKRKTVSFSASVGLDGRSTQIEAKINEAGADKFRRIHAPDHPGADESGYTNFPDINQLVETTDLRSSQLSQSALVNAFEINGKMTTEVQRLMD